MTNFLHSLILFAFLATGFADTLSVHQAYSKSSMQTFNQTAGFCSASMQTKPVNIDNSCIKSTKSVSNHPASDKSPASQPLSECEMLHCNSHYLFVAQISTIERAPNHDTHLRPTKSKPFVIRLSPSKRPPRTFS